MHINSYAYLNLNYFNFNRCLGGLVVEYLACKYKIIGSNPGQSNDFFFKNSMNDNFMLICTDLNFVTDTMDFVTLRQIARWTL